MLQAYEWKGLVSVELQGNDNIAGVSESYIDSSIYPFAT